MKSRFSSILPIIFIASFTAYSSTVYLTPNSSLQNAINTLSSGSTIILQDGIYTVPEVIQIYQKTGITIRGQSKNAIVKFSSGFNLIPPNSSAWSDPSPFNLFNIRACSNVTFQNIHFNGTGRTGTIWQLDGPFNSAIYISSSTNISVTDCEFEDDFANGIYAYTSVSNSKFADNFIHGRIYSTGIVLNSASCNNNIIQSNFIDIVGPMGIWITDGAHHNSINSNIVKWCSAEAIVCEGQGPDSAPSTRNSICSNIISNCIYGIVLRCHSFGIVDGNAINDCKVVGIQLMPEDPATHSNNIDYQVINNISSNNLIINCGTDKDYRAGITVGAPAPTTQVNDGNTIIGNTIYGGNHGIKVQDANNCAIISNSFSNLSDDNNTKGIWNVNGTSLKINNYCDPVQTVMKFVLEN
jgi:parallel beta-helix repeat protein